VLSTVGDDPLGDWCAAQLRTRGVDTSLLRRVPGMATGMAIIFIGAGDKRMVTVEGPPRETAMRTLPDADLGSWSHLHVTGSPVEALTDLVRRGRDHGLSASIEWNGRAMDRVARYAELHLMNADELARLERPADSVDVERDTVGELAPDLARRLDSDIVVTLGARGAVWCSPGDDPVVESTVTLEPVDRTGGGDAFDAGIVSGFLRGESREQCLRRGLALASEVLMVAGGFP
jgi:ribokinase